MAVYTYGDLELIRVGKNTQVTLRIDKDSTPWFDGEITVETPDTVNKLAKAINRRAWEIVYADMVISDMYPAVEALMEGNEVQEPAN